MEEPSTPKLEAPVKVETGKTKLDPRETKLGPGETKLDPGETLETKSEDTKKEEECLVCFRKFQTSSNVADNLPLNQLHDLLKVFQISLASIEHLCWQELPFKLFCADCTDRIIDAVQLLLRIECLQNDFRALKKILRRDLVTGWSSKDGCDINETMDVVRKTLVQCLSSCEVVVKPASFNRPPENPMSTMPVSLLESDEYESMDFAAMDDDFMQLLSPVTILTPEVMQRGSRGFYRRGCTTSEESGEEESTDEESLNPEVPEVEVVEDDFQPTDDDFDNDYNPFRRRSNLRRSRTPSNVKLEGSRHGKRGPRSKKIYPFHCDKCGKGLVSQNALSLHESKYCGELYEANKSEGPSGQRYYGDDGKMIGYDCPFCFKKISRADYSTETGSYLFKCFPDCCDKVMDNFSNLVVHHDANCPSKPVELQSITRKSKRMKPPQMVTSEGTKNKVCINVNDGFQYDDNKAVIGFQCPHCQKSLSRSDFLVESGEFMFKCDWDLCDKITSTLSNLAYHHATHCSNNRRGKRKRKYPKKVKTEYVVNQSSFTNSDHAEQNSVEQPKLQKTSDSQTHRKRGRPKKEFPFNCQKCGKGFLSDTVLSLHEANHDKIDSQQTDSNTLPKQTYRVYEDGKLIAYNCPFCQRKMSEQEYLTESGEYVFKCFPECCDKITGKFLNLIYHHEAFCPSKPKDLYSNKRKYRRNTRQRREGLTYNKRISTSATQNLEDISQNSEVAVPNTEVAFQNTEDTISDPSLSDATTSNIHHDEDGKLIAYECPFCDRKLYRENFYSPETGTYLFKCFPDYCDKTADNFGNLITHHKSCCPMAPPRRKRAKKRAVPSVTARVVPPKTGVRVYDSSSKLVSFECSFCERVMSREAYLVEPGNYNFKCFPECCDKIMDHFSNLVSHHEAYCNQRPTDLYSKTRKSMNVTKPKDANSADTTSLDAANSETSNADMESNVNVSAETPAVKAGRRIYDGNNKLICFECPFCEKNLSKEDYFCPEVSDYLFKCDPACCEKTTDNFPNLVYHHEAYCPSKPVELYSKKTHRRLKERLKVGTSNNIICVSKGFKFNNARSVIGFECPRCQKEMTPSDFKTESGEFVFKCGWNSCDKVCTTFANLAYHHEAHCADRPRKPKWKPPKKADLVGQIDVKIEKPPKKEKKSLEPVYCDQCGKCFKKHFDLVRHMVSHSDERPFACDQCPYRCKRNKNLRIHMRMHNDERPFLCPACGKTFRSSSALNHHEKSHWTGTFDCTFCNRMFKSQQDLDTHVTRIHSQEAGNISGGHSSGTSGMQMQPNVPYDSNLDLISLWNPMF